MIKLINASKTMRSKGLRNPIVQGVTVDIPRGRSTALLGRNGAGKSTLLRIISGAMTLDSGKIARFGTVSWPLGFRGSFQASMTGEQNVRFVARIYERVPSEVIEEVEEFAELGPYFKQPVGEYSSGMRARLAFGLSMAVNFDYYLVDEITAVGDANFKRKCRSVFEHKRERSDVIMVSHSLAAIKAFCHCGMVLEGGKLSFYDDIHDAIEAHKRNLGLNEWH
jgi:capsular polysaccharide transport system ATP-binding protein